MLATGARPSINQTDIDGNSPLSMACDKKNLKLAVLLRRNGAGLEESKKNEGHISWLKNELSFMANQITIALEPKTHDFFSRQTARRHSAPEHLNDQEFICKLATLNAVHHKKN